MSLPPVARRGLAVLASTALLTSGAAGLFTGNAFAANSAAITSVSPAVTNNSGNTAVTVTGQNLGTTPDANGDYDTINFKLSDPSNSQYGAATPTLSFTPTTTDNPSSHTSTSYSGTLNTTNAAPGYYDVYDTSASGGNGAALSKAFYIGSQGAPDVTNILPGSDTRSSACKANPTCSNKRGPMPIDIFGRNLAKASKVNLLLPNGQVDKGPDSTVAAPTITVIDKNNTGGYSGYASSALMYAEVGVTSDNFTPGRHLVNVTNTNVTYDADPTKSVAAPQTGAAGELWLPKFAASGVSPSSMGQGANKTITITGQGIRQGSRIVIEDLSDPTDPTQTSPDNTVGAATVSADGTTISAPVSLASDAATGQGRTVSILGPDGGLYRVANAFTVNPAPKITGVSPSKLGQGGTEDVSITGTGFAVGATPATAPVFTFSGTGVSVVTKSSTNLGATISVTAAPDATPGTRTITVTNPDGGSSTFSGPNANTPAFTIDAGPTIASVTPANAAVGKSATVTITGQNFDNPNVITGSPKPTVTFAFPPSSTAPRTADNTVTAGPLTVTKGANGAPDKATFTVTVSNSAVAGLRDLIITNSSDNGQYICSTCFGVDSISVSPTTGQNTGTKQITFTAGSAIPSGSTAKLSKAGDSTVQPDIVGSSTSISGNSISAIFDLTSAATGPYNGIVTTPGGSTFSCSSCFTVTGVAPTVSSISPASGGQGATNRAASITGTNFSRGMKVTITDVTVHDVTFVSPTKMNVLIDIPTNAPTGTKDVTVANNDASQSGKATSAYTVTAAPTIKSVSPTSLGQGAKDAKITVTGSGFQKGSTPDTSSTVSFGPGITVTSVAITKGNGLPAPLGSDDTLVATVTVDPNAALTARDVTVSNPDGGVGVSSAAFTVNPGPKVTSITPNFLAPDGSGDVTITGSNFSTTSGKTAVPSIQDVTLSNVQVVSPTSITATATVNSGAAKGAKDVLVTNPTDSGAGTCTGCFYVATPPSAPVQVHAVSVSGTSATVGWTAPSDNGGAPITSYVVSAKGPDGKAAGTAATTGASATSGTVTGLTAGVKYTISVVARNVAGDSDAGTTLVQTTGTASTVPQMTINKTAMNVGQSAIIIIRGTPGDSVGFYQRVQPATTFSLFKTFTFDSLGNVTITTFPRTNTAYGARTAAGVGNFVSLSVRPAVSLRGSSSHRLATFTGVIVPGHGGVQVRIYSVQNGRLGSLVATATTDSQGHYTATHQFAGTGTVQFIAQTISDKIALAGQSNRLNLTIQ